MTPTRNNPGYTPEYNELSAARALANETLELCGAENREIISALRWLAAEVRVMRLERALEKR